MDDQRVGRIIRALRHRRGWRQIDLARAANCSQNLVSLVERGHMDRVAIRMLRRILRALDASAFIDLRWRGAALDRLADEGHALLVGFVAGRLQRLGWQIELEATYSRYGERGSYDILAFHGETGSLLVVEAKTDLPSAEATLRKLDEKERLAVAVGRDRFDWRAKSVSVALIMPAARTLRRRIERHQGTLGTALPSHSIEVRRWLARPVGRLAGIWFVSGRDSRVAIPGFRQPERIRKATRSPRNPPVAA